jgi:hypothetical protein
MYVCMSHTVSFTYTHAYTATSKLAVEVLPLYICSPDVNGAYVCMSRLQSVTSSIHVSFEMVIYLHLLGT